MKSFLQVNFILLFLVCLCLPMKAQGEDPYDTIIVGGGIAGMTAAYLLQSYNIKVLEKRAVVGGRAFSGTYRGFTYARGTEYLGKPEEPLDEIVEDLGLELKEIPYPADVQLYNGKYYYGDMGKALSFIEQTDLKTYNRFVKIILKTYEAYEDVPELDIKSPIMALDDLTARRWFIKNKFPQPYQDAYNVTFKGLFGATIDEISALSALTEIAFDYEDFEVIEDLDDLENDPTPGKYETGMYSFEKGISEIPIAIARQLGDKVQTNSTVTDVFKEGDLYKVTYQDATKQQHSYFAETVILATPSAISIRIAGRSLSNEQKKIMKQVEYAPYLTLALFSEVPIFNKGFDMAMPNDSFFTDLYDATWIERYYDKKLQNKNVWITTIYIAPKSYKDRSYLKMSEEEIMEKVYKHLEKYLPGSRQKVLKHELNRFYYAYPVLTPGAYKRLTRLHQITNDGLFLAGDYMTYPTFEAAAVSGQIAAEKVEDWLDP